MPSRPQVAALLSLVLPGAGLAALALAGCASHYNLASRREDFTLVSTTREVETGARLARQVERELPQLADDATQARVRAIGERLAAVAERHEVVYRFGVIDEDEVNAFSLPGGWVYVYKGLIKKTASDDELAGVIAHEIAHVAARHAMNRYEAGLGAQLLQLAVIASRSPNAVGATIAAQAARLAYARQDELEADRLAVQYLRAAGYDPTAMLRFLDTLQEVHLEHKPRYMPRLTRPQYALTHPFVAERQRTVKEALYGVADYIDYLNSPRWR